jgi:hypothetical protein
MAINLVNRVQRILLSPSAEWDVIDKEPVDIPGTLTTYVAPLVVASAIAGFLGSLLFRPTFMGIAIGPSMTGLLIVAIVNIVLAIVMVYVFAFIVDALAPSFNAQKNFGQAFKVSAFSGTAGWVGGIFTIIPVIGWIIALAGAIYSLVLIFLGLPKLMKAPQDKGVIYTVVAVVIMVVIYLIIGYVQSRLMASFMMSTLTVPTIPGQ